MNHERIERILSEFEKLPPNRLALILNEIFDSSLGGMDYEQQMALLQVNLYEFEMNGILERYEETLLTLANQG